jgi:hypothetical protein
MEQVGIDAREGRCGLGQAAAMRSRAFTRMNADYLAFCLNLVPSLAMLSRKGPTLAS